MAIPQKFLFEVSFDEEEVEEEILEPIEPDEPPPPPPPSYTDADLAEARAEAFTSGRAAGEQAERESTGRLAAEALARLAATAEAVAGEIGEVRGAAERRAVEIGMLAVRKLAPELLRREGASEIEALLRESLGGMFDEPRLVLRVSDALLDALRERIDGIAARAGYPGRIVLIAQDGLVDGDCRIEWADGGVERSAPRLSAEIEAAVTQALAALPTRRSD